MTSRIETIKAMLEENPRDFESDATTDIINKKRKILRMFEEDPDLLTILGQKDPKIKKPNIEFEDMENPTEDELKTQAEIDAYNTEVDNYNERIKHRQIIPYLKLNGIQKEVLNFVMFDIDDTDVSYSNNVIKNQYLIIMCLVHEDDMDTEYEIPRTDLLDYIVKDLLCWTNALGMQLKCVNDFQDIIDTKYYCRTIKFRIETPNNVQGGGNKYDRFHQI